MNLCKTDFVTFLKRIVLLYLLFFICRISFYIYNYSILEGVEFSDLSGLIKGSFIFDSASIFYLNIPFLLLSLIPIEARQKAWYQKMLYWLFVVINSLALLPNVADIFYYEFRLGRVTFDDFRYVGEDNVSNIFISFVKDYWYGFIGYILLVWLLSWSYKHISYHPTIKRGWKSYYIGGAVSLAASIVVAIALIRGGSLSPAIFPIKMSDASIFVNKSAHSSLILSNPFCVIRTAGGGLKYSKYFETDKLDELYPVTSTPTSNSQYSIDSTTNIVLLILESFGAAHIGALNGENTPYTPFFDSLANEGLLFTNAYYNGIRSIDALPAIWGSIPSFKRNFLSFPTSVAPTKTLPTMLGEMGYTTAFMHGAVRKSMSFVAFSKKNGVDQTFSQEDYEQERGTNDFDGTWGIWDSRFLDYAADKITEMKKPLFTTIFTLSSHAPFVLPDHYKGEVTEGTLPIHKTIRYSDSALREFFAKLSKEPFYKNTLFILTADHSSGADSQKFKEIPYSFSVPILFYKPGSNLVGRYEKLAAHIDIMPTVLSMINYKKPYFGFGRNLFVDSNKQNFTVNYQNGGFNIVTDSTTYIFNEKEIISTIGSDSISSSTYDRAEAFIQQYYTHVENGDFLPKEL